MSISVPTAPQLRTEDLGVSGPQADAAIAVVNQFMQDVCNSLAQLEALSQPLTGKRFTTPAAGNGVLTLSTNFARVRHVSAVVERPDGVAITAAYSHTFRNLPTGQLEVQFQGLTASTTYLASLVLE